MCSCVYLVVLIFSVCSGRISSSALIQAVKPEENITLHCSNSSSTEMIWYRHISDELTVIISAIRGKFDKHLQQTYNEEPAHFTTPGDSLSLTIRNIRQSDIGLYYCGVRLNGVMNITRGFHLQFTDAVMFTSAAEQCWTSLISVCCAFMLLLFLIVVYKRGPFSSPCKKCVRDDRVKEADLHYASLRHNTTPQAGVSSPANHSVIYNEVSRSVVKDPSV